MKKAMKGKESTSPGITPIQQENAKTYVPEMTTDGWPVMDGFVPDDEQIVIAEEKDKSKREALEQAMGYEVSDEVTFAPKSNYRTDIQEIIEADESENQKRDPDEITLMPGMKLDRYTWKGEKLKGHQPDGSDDGGYYFGTPGMSFEARSLRSPRNEYDYYEYEVLKPFNVRAGVVAQAYDLPGGGDQYKSLDRQRANWLIKNGYIRVTRFNGKEVSATGSLIEKRDWKLSILTLALTLVFAIGIINTFASFEEGGFVAHFLTGLATFSAVCAEFFALKKFRLLKNSRTWSILLLILLAFDIFMLPVFLNKAFAFVISLIITGISIAVALFFIGLPSLTSSASESGTYKITTTTIDEKGRSSVETQTYYSEADFDSAKRELKSKGYTEEQ